MRPTRSRTRDFTGLAERILLGASLLLLPTVQAQQKVNVPTGPPTNAASIPFRDSRYGVRFEVPPGWNFTRKDREVSTFRLDARTAPPRSEVRGVASLGFNPFPRSVLSGALVYFSVAKHATDQSCAAQATAAEAPQDQVPKLDWRHENPTTQGIASIGGMPFAHGHDERGGICVEQRDEVYTAYRKGSCYRFDLAVNTFCTESSGALELNRDQMHSLEAQMTGILSTVTLDWERSGPQPVPVPDIHPSTPLKNFPKPPPATGQKAVVGVGA
jgi:hypothetical protein